MSIHSRVIAITAGLALTGAASGALSGVVAIVVAVLIFLQTLAPLAFVGPASAIGAVFGAIVSPALAWIALRHVPLGRAIAWISVGAGIGGAIGVLVGAPSVNPYEALAINLAPVPQGVIGALAGSTIAAGVLRLRSKALLLAAAPSNEEL